MGRPSKQTQAFKKWPNIGYPTVRGAIIGYNRLPSIKTSNGWQWNNGYQIGDQ